MASAETLILPSDVRVVPMAQLPPELQAQIPHAPGDHSVTRPRSRTMTSVVDAGTAALLEVFRRPTTIVDAVIAFSTTRGLDPRAVLDDSFSVICGFVDEGLLVPADGYLARPIATSLAPGDRVGGYEVVEAVHVMVDTEVYRVRARDGSAAALKIAGQAADGRQRAAIRHEAAILGRLDGRVSPCLFQTGEHEGRPFLACSWCAGVDVHRAAEEARALAEPDRSLELVKLTARVMEAYSHLNAQGVLHGDVHPRNVLVAGDGAVTLVDFGLAVRAEVGVAPDTSLRGGIDFFLEPEAAAGWLVAHEAPTSSAAGEQYAVGALAYLVLTGAHTHAFSLEREEMLRQLVEEPPLTFSHHGVTNLPSVEQAVTKALAKDPHDRYSSIQELLRSFRAAAGRPSEDGRRSAVPSPARQLLDDVLLRLDVPGDLFATGLVAPTASVMIGAAGLGYALMRIAGICDDERLLALADLWSAKALRADRSDDAYINAELDIVPATFGSNSFYHHASGVHAVQAIIAQARADDTAQQLSLKRFIAVAAQSCEHVDLVFGRAGLLLGCALMLECQPTQQAAEPLRATGNSLRDSLWAELDGRPALADGTELRALGVAHGWAGYLYALLSWSEISATPLPAGLEERLEQLAALGEPVGRGLRWPHEQGAAAADTGLAGSWCNGAAGFVPLWVLARRRLGDEAYDRLAQQAAWGTFEGRAEAPGDLCCGSAGRAYALLSLYRHTGESAWLARAHTLADVAATRVRRQALRRDSLYKGEIGVALLAAELDAPEEARIPLFEVSGVAPAPRR